MPENSHKMLEARQQEYQRSVTVGVLVGLLCFLILGRITWEQVIWPDNRSMQASMGLVYSVNQNANRLLDDLNQLPQQPCSDQLLLKLRQETFLNPFVSDIGYFIDGSLACSAGLGRQEPTPVTRPHFTTAAGLDVNILERIRLLEQPERGIALKKDRFNLLIAESYLVMVLPQTDYEWRVDYFTTSGSFNLLKSRHDVPPIHIPVERSLCSGDGFLCMTATTDLIRAIVANWLLIIVVMFTSVASGVAAAMVFYQWRRSDRRTEKRIREALNKHSFSLAYQPIIRLRDKKVVGCEVLARLEDDFGIIAPDDFIPIVAQLKATWEFTGQIIQQSLTELDKVPASIAPHHVALNIFPRDLVSGNILQLLDLPAYKKTPYRITLEVTEHEKLDSKSAEKHVARLKRSGIELAIDDFGTGYSSLQQLKSLRCDVVKIDRSFVQDLTENSIRSQFVPHIIKIAEICDLQVVAEGVENEEESQIVTEMGAEFAQGFHFGHPMSLENWIGYLRAKNQSGDVATR